MILTAKDEQVDKIIGLEIGADDYLTKPFSPREVLARMKAIFRRLKPTTTETLQEDTPKAPLVIGEIRVDEQNYEVFVRNQPIELTPKEFELLVYFMKRKDRVINQKPCWNEFGNMTSLDKVASSMSTLVIYVIKSSPIPNGPFT